MNQIQTNGESPVLVKSQLYVAESTTRLKQNSLLSHFQALHIIWNNWGPMIPMFALPIPEFPRHQLIIGNGVPISSLWPIIKVLLNSPPKIW